MVTTRHASKARHNNDALVQRLPDELLLRTFMFIYESLGASEQHGPRPMPNDPETWEANIVSFLLNITSVCSVWRTIAISAPLLWSTISCISVDKDTWSGVSRRLHTFLTRSKKVPLDIYIALFDSLVSPESEKGARILLKHLSRCRSLHIAYLSDTGHAAKIFPLQGCSPKLINLDVQVMHEYYIEIPQILPAVNPVSLRYLRLRFDLATQADLKEMLATFRPEALLRVSLSGQEMWWETSFEYMSRCLDAETIHNRIQPPNGSPPIQPFALDKLKSLGIATQFPITFPRLITTPLLEKLTFYPAIPNFDDPRGPGHEINATVFPSLRIVDFAEYSFMDEELPAQLQFFHANPTIEVINVKSDCEGFILLIHLLGGIAITDGLDPEHEFEWSGELGDGPWLPMLKRLTFTGSSAIWTLDAVDFLIGITKVMERWPDLRVECDRESFDGGEPDVGLLKKQFGDRFVQMGTGWNPFEEVWSDSDDSDSDLDSGSEDEDGDEGLWPLGIFF